MQCKIPRIHFKNAAITDLYYKILIRNMPAYQRGVILICIKPRLVIISYHICWTVNPQRPSIDCLGTDNRFLFIFHSIGHQ
jgi:hypothetical protein